MTIRDSPGITRRGFLAATGNLALATATSSLAADRKATTTPDYDVIVVGGGFAGVTAARELKQAGLSTLLVEARNRLGGRSLTSNFDGRATDLGGTWIHWSQPYVWAEAKRYGLSLAETAGAAADDFIYESRGKMHRKSMGEIWEPLDAAVRAYFAPSREIFPRPFDASFNEAAARVDGISGLDRLQGLNLSEDQKNMVNAYFSTTGHNALDQIAWVELLRCYALSGHDLVDLNDALARYRFADGTQALLDAIWNDAGAEILLGTPAAKISRDADGVTLLSENDETLRARYLVMTAPMNVLKDIEFSPPLDPVKLAASRETHAGVGTKFHALLKGEQGNLGAAAPTTHGPQPISYLLTEHMGHENTHMIGFGPSPALLNVSDPAALQAAIRKFLPDAEVVASLGYHWNLDPFSQGTWCLYRPGQYGRCFPALRASEGRVVFANSDWADGWRGFLDGAIESGLRASQEVKQAMG